MCLLGVGKTISEIAGELALSVKTVSTYRVRILEKLNLSNTAEIVRYAIQRGLIQ
jgi:DNA-binding NarL/FixJ family response regulator